MQIDYAYIRCVALLKALLRNAESKNHRKALIDILTVLEIEGKVEIPFLDVTLTSTNVFYYSYVRNILKDIISSENNRLWVYTPELFKNTSSAAFIPFSKLKPLNKKELL